MESGEWKEEGREQREKQKAASKKQKAKRRAQRVESREKKEENRKPKAKSKELRAGSREPSREQVSTQYLTSIIIIFTQNSFLKLCPTMETVLINDIDRIWPVIIVK